MDNYINYQTMLSDVNTNLVTLRKACTRMGMEEYSEALKEIQGRLQNHTFRVGVMGEFNRGKSTVINALLEKEIIPADILPTSATLNRILWDAQPHAVINFKKEINRESLDVPVEQLADYVTKLSEESEKMAEEVEDAIVYYPCNFCKNGVEIVDTPGLNDDDRMNYISENVIPSLDAIIMVLVPEVPFSMSEAAFVRNKMMTSDLSRLIFVVNKIDTVRAKDRVRVVDNIRKRINESVLEKSASMYGADSAEYKDIQNKLAGIRIYPISAMNALEAIEEGDDEAFKKSGMADFENGLSKLLTEERGMLELVSPVGVILSKAKDVLNAIEMRANAMAMDKENFEKVQKEAMERIEEQREEKKAKVKEIKGLAASTYQELLPMVSDAYNNLEQVLTAFIEQYPISAADFSGNTAEELNNSLEEFNNLISGKINDQMVMVLQENTEKMQVEVANRINTVIEGLEVYNQQLTMELNGISCMIPDASKVYSGNTALDYAAAGLEIATNFTGIVPGLGAAITGFRDHGVLGGVVGLGAGYVATVAAANGAFYALAAVGLGATSVVLPAALIIGGILGAVGGKKITNVIFNFFGKEKKKTVKVRALKESDLQSIRNSIQSSAINNINQLRTEQVLEKWLKDTTDSTFGDLSAKVDEETEQALQGMSDTLTQIQIDLANNETERAESMRRLKETQEEMMSVLRNIKPIKDKLDAAMAQPAEA